MSEKYLEEFIRGYKVAAMWSSTHMDDTEDPTPIDLLDPEPEWSDEALKEIKETCTDFMETNKADLEIFVEEIPYDPTQGTPWDYGGHDFWLTRNGHGVGYWERGLGKLGDRLTEASAACGSQDLEVGDDGKLYIM